MQSGLFKLGWRDLAKGLLVVVGTSIVIAVAGVVMTPNFDVFATDWLIVGKNMVNIGIVAFMGYLLKQLFTDNNGKVAGVVNLG
jgi:hypothetical protein